VSPIRTTSLVLYPPANRSPSIAPACPPRGGSYRLDLGQARVQGRAG
jgi:hypothetical protein